MKEDTTGKVKAALYLRISQDREGEQAGVKRQEADCRKLAKTKGWEVVAVLTDNDISASKGRRRPAYEALLEGIEGGRFEAVVVWHADRLHRRPVELEEFIELADRRRTKLASCTGDIDLSTDDGRLVARLLAAVAKKEVEAMGRRIGRKHQERAEAGLPHPGGKRAFGYDYDREAKTYRIVPEEAALIRRIARDVQRGRSLGSIVAELNANGVRTIRGGKWWLSNMRDLLLSPVIAGRRVHRRTGIDVQGNWKPIISLPEQERLRAILEDPARREAKGGPHRRRHLLSGILTCGVCGAKLYPSHGGYVCSRTTSGQGCLRVAEKMADEVVYEETLMQFLGRPQIAKRVETTEEEDALVSERLTLLARRDELAEKYADGLLDDRGYTVGVRRLDKRIKDIEESLSALLREQVTVVDETTFGGLLRKAGPWAKNVSKLTEVELLQRREFITTMVERVEVTKASARGKVEPGRLHVVWKEHRAPKQRRKKAAA